MITITFKYTDYEHNKTQEFREYTKNLIGYRDDYDLKYGIERDLMFDDKVVCQMSVSDEEYAFDVVNHFMLDREINGENVPFDVDLSSIAIYVTGSDRIMHYLTSRSFSNLYERLEIAEGTIYEVVGKNQKLEANQEQMASFIQNVGVDKFPDIVRQLMDSMEAEGHDCKQEINKILQRKVH